MEKFKNVTVFDHPLIKHKIAILRDEKTGMKEFRELIEEIATLMTYEAFKDVPTKKVMVKTPLEETEQTVVVEKSIVLVPVLRAGLGMVNGVHVLFPTAKVGHIGMFRNEETLEPQEYYCKLPKDVADMEVFVTDPMLATGGTAIAGINFIKERGAKKITFLCILAAPEGVKALKEAHPDVDIYAAAYDSNGLNDHGYIVPGLGDAGDRIFGTK